MKRNLGKISICPRGEWDETERYSILDAVNYRGSSYLAKQNSIGILPTNTDYWMLLANRGLDNWDSLSSADMDAIAQRLNTSYLSRLDAIDADLIPLKTNVTALLNSTVYLTESEYAELVANDEIDEDTEYNIIEDDDE